MKFKSVLLVLVALAYTSAYAEHDGGNGLNEAAAACSKATFGSDVTKCMGVVNSAQYFDIAAAQACGEMSFSSSVPECMAAIANKAYLPAQISTCASPSFDKDKISCFRTSGKPFIPGPPAPVPPAPSGDEFILESLLRVEMNIKSGKIRQALFDIADLIRFVEQRLGRSHR